MRNSHEPHPPPAGVVQGLQVSPCDILQRLFFNRQISDQLFQPAIFGLKLFQPFSLIDRKPTVFIAPTTIALLSGARFRTSHRNRFALGLQHLNLAQFRYNLLRRKSSWASPFQFDTPISSG